MHLHTQKLSVLQQPGLVQLERNNLLTTQHHTQEEVEASSQGFQQKFKWLEVTDHLTETVLSPKWWQLAPEETGTCGALQGLPKAGISSFFWATASKTFSFQSSAYVWKTSAGENQETIDDLYWSEHLQILGIPNFTKYFIGSFWLPSYILVPPKINSPKPYPDAAAIKILIYLFKKRVIEK